VIIKGRVKELAEQCPPEDIAQLNKQIDGSAKHPGGRPLKLASERAESVVHVRVTAARKAAYMAAAKARGMSFSQWVQEWLDYAVDDGYRG